MNQILKLIGEAEEDFSEYEDLLKLDAEQEKTQFNRAPVTTPEEAFDEAERLGRGNVPEWIEEIIARSPVKSAQYAVNVLNARFPLGEPSIARSAIASVDYARWAVKLGDFVPGSKRFPPGEPVVAESGYMSLMYTNYVVKPGDFVPGSKRFPPGEKAIAATASYSYDYAQAIGERFRLGEPVIKRDRRYLGRYKQHFVERQDELN